MKTHNILIIVDAQNDFINGSLANKEAQEAVPRIVELINSQDWDAIIATQDTHYNTYLETKEGQLLPIEHCIRNTEGWKINSDILLATFNSSAKEYQKIEKNTFGYLDICQEVLDIVHGAPYVDEYNITIVGFCTDICVISNALILKAGYYSNGNIYVKADCCAGVTPESHEAALTVMRNCQINVI